MQTKRHGTKQGRVWMLAALCLAGAAGLGAEGNQPGAVYNGNVVNVQNGSMGDWRTEAPRHLQAPPLAPEEDPNERGLSLGGPRIGFSYINGGGYDKLVEAVRKAKPGADVEAGMSQFGWQAEYRFYRNERGLTALTEIIPLVGGLDQGLALPSVTWMLGLRGRNGFEFGVGPNLGLNGAGLMIGTGYTMDLGGINVPFNIAVGRGSYQTTSFAISTGFNL